uniref:Peptidase S1 domain-containing protein n=1 Tax=Cuerna arida TaxID=1464854 RepID=A0A1B6FAW4_9HEMI
MTLWPLTSKTEEKCLSNTGIEGFCRSQMECLGVNTSIESSNCSIGHICCPNGRVSEKRCDGYADTVYKTNVDTYDTDNDLDDNREDECGIAAVPLIIGGEQAEYKEFPHMVVIGYGPHLTTAKWLCGGSLVSEFYILTAAHCLISHQGEPTFVKLGVINLENTC